GTRRVSVTSMPGNKTGVPSCAAAEPPFKAATLVAIASAAAIRCGDGPMTRSFVCGSLAGRPGETTETKDTERKPAPGSDRRYAPAAPRGGYNSLASDRGRNISHGLRVGCGVTAAKRRSVWSFRPPVGRPRWQVSWLAGQYLRSSLPSFPVADADDRLAAY